MKYINFSLPSILLIALVVKCLIVGTSSGDAVAVLGLAALYGYNSFLTTTNEKWQNVILKQITDVKNEMNVLKMKSNVTTKSTSNGQQNPNDYKRLF